MSRKSIDEIEARQVTCWSALDADQVRPASATFVLLGGGFLARAGPGRLLPEADCPNVEKTLRKGMTGTYCDYWKL